MIDNDIFHAKSVERGVGHLRSYPNLNFYEDE
jgi:hypothetical protein